MKTIENKKKVTNVICQNKWWMKINWHNFGLVLILFSTFHLDFLQLCNKLPSYISRTHQFLFSLVNNCQKSCQKLCNIFLSLHLLQGECAMLLHFKPIGKKYFLFNMASIYLTMVHHCMLVSQRIETFIRFPGIGQYPRPGCHILQNQCVQNLTGAVLAATVLAPC